MGVPVFSYPRDSEQKLSKIQTYIDRTTVSELKFVQKVLERYMYYLLTGSAKGILERLFRMSEPSEEWFLFRELGEDAVLFSGYKYLHIFSYSVQHKNWKLFLLISEVFNLGGVEERYGANLRSKYITKTDEIPLEYTDHGFTTDMDNSYPVIIVYFLDFAYNTSYGLPSYDEISKRFLDAAPLISLVKPARIPVIPLYRPNYVLSRFTEEGLTVTSNPVKAEPERFDGLTDEEISSLYRTLVTDSGTTIEITQEYFSPRKRIWHLMSHYEIKTVTLESGSSQFDDFVFSVNFDSELFGEGKNYNKYLFRICFNFSDKESEDNFIMTETETKAGDLSDIDS